jgi:hypothetical protein
VALTPRAFATPRAASPQRGTKRSGNFASQTQANIQRNSGAQAGDALILTKALGVGIYSAAFKRDALSLEAYQEFIGTATLLNHVGAKISKDTAVHAVTDVTGFGLLGHALEMARRSDKASGDRNNRCGDATWGSPASRRDSHQGSTATGSIS